MQYIFINTLKRWLGLNRRVEYVGGKLDKFIIEENKYREVLTSDRLFQTL